MDPHTVPSSDQVRRFIFEKQPVRGHWVRLEGAWRELRAHADYPPVVSELLGQAVAASVLLAATLKFRGTLTFQLQGNGAVGLLVAQCAHDFRVRAVARGAGGTCAMSRPKVWGNGRFRGPACGCWAARGGDSNAAGVRAGLRGSGGGSAPGGWVGCSGSGGR